MLGIVRPTDRHGLRGGPRRDQSRLDPPYGTLPRSPQPEMRALRRDCTGEDSKRKRVYANLQILIDYLDGKRRQL